MTGPASYRAFAASLLDWWDVHGRTDLPWQRDPTPYRVWVSEIMLQQTQVATVARYYDHFVNAFPDVRALADAEPDSVLHRWSGLGYYARARNLHRAARIVRDEYDCSVPGDFDALLSLPGIGRSTAGAILALSMNRAFPILDGNAKRVLARHFGVTGWPGESAVNQRLWEIAEACTCQRRPGHYTQAIMDLGASVCTRGQPGCEACPLSNSCVALRDSLTSEIPGPRPKRNRPTRAVTLVMVVRDDDAILLERRASAGIWGGLWAFPELAGVDGINGWCRATVGVRPAKIVVREEVTHGFTHFELRMTPVEVRVTQPRGNVMDGDGLDDERWLWYNRSQPAEIGLAAPIAKLIQSLGDRP